MIQIKQTTEGLVLPFNLDIEAAKEGEYSINYPESYNDAEEGSVKWEIKKYYDSIVERWNKGIELEEEDNG